MFVPPTRDKVLQLWGQGLPQAAIARALDITKSTVAFHLRAVRQPDSRFRRRYDWIEVQSFYDAGHSVNECVARFGFSKQTWHAAKNRGDIVTRPHAMPIERLLSAPRCRTHLKKRLLSAGLLRNICAMCGIAEWQGKPLALELHHVNGVAQDNRLENLALLCPNCHSQTDSWGGRNRERRTPAANAA
jgi:hypothetical protein